LPSPTLMDDPRALPQRNPRCRPARNGRPKGRFGYLEVVRAVLEHYFGRFTHAAARCKSIFDNAGIVAAVVERKLREWCGARRAKLAEAGAR
jgi:hypothetical protein